LEGPDRRHWVEYAQTHGYAVRSEWVVSREGYSGASWFDGLEKRFVISRARADRSGVDHSPDGSAGKYALQVLLAKSFRRCGRFDSDLLNRILETS